MRSNSNPFAGTSVEHISKSIQLVKMKTAFTFRSRMLNPCGEKKMHSPYICEEYDDFAELFDYPFLETLREALKQAIATTQRTMKKAAFWRNMEDVAISDRQRKVINMLWDGFDGKLTTGKWAKINHCSQDTALRDIEDLIRKGILRRAEKGGRSTNYELIEN